MKDSPLSAPRLPFIPVFDRLYEAGVGPLLSNPLPPRDQAQADYVGTCFEA